MAIPRETTGTDEVLRDARFHIASLQAHPRATSLVDAVRTVAADLKERRNAAEQKEEARVDALARLLRTDYELDDGLRQLQLDVLGAVNKNRADVKYRAVFPRGLSAIVVLRGAAEAREVGRLCEELRARLPELAERHGAELERLAAASAEAETQFRQAEVDAAAAFGQERLARAELVHQLQKSEGALLIEFAGQRSRVRSFFRPTRRRGAVGPEDATEPGADTPAE
jgi:hypothetical protein